MSNNAIAKLFGMTRQTVDNVVRDHAKNPESGKFAPPESSSSPSTVLPLAPTLDRPETREDAAQPAVGRGYNNYPKDDYEARLSTICKAKRDAAILEKHKEGMTAYAIAKLFKIKKQDTVQDVIDKARTDYSKNPDSGKMEYPEASPSTVPMASTDDRPETREDAAAYFDAELQSLVSPDFMQDFDDDAIDVLSERLVKIDIA